MPIQRILFIKRLKGVVIMIKLLTTFLLTILYFIVLFKNGLSLNEITIPYTVLILCCWLMMLGIIHYWKKNGTGLSLLIFPILVLMFTTYDAIVSIPLEDQRYQKELALILGSSPDYLALPNLNNESILRMMFYGDPKSGNFDQNLGYIVEIYAKGELNPFYFQCKGNGPYCNSFEQLDLSEAKFRIKYLHAY